MRNTINSGVSCGVCDCTFNRDGMSCTLDKIHVGNTCSEGSVTCTCCDSYRQKN